MCRPQKDSSEDIFPGSDDAVSSFGKKCTWILEKSHSMYKIYDLIIIAIQDFMR